MNRMASVCAWVLTLVALVTGLVAPPAARAQTPPVDAHEMEAFADTFFATQMRDLQIPGAVLVIVQGDHVLLAKGYGFSSLENGTPFDPDRTVVAVGSVSKLFVATAVMQLVEQGRLRLDAGVNDYLAAFRLPYDAERPVTIAHLLTHTAGFDSPYGDLNFDPAAVRPLEQYLVEHRPALIRPPGEIQAYSNYGYALLGYVVECVTGTPFEEYVTESILRPLGMEHTRYFYRPPAPEALAAGYSFWQGGRAPQPIDYDSEYPGGALVATASDMAVFLLAHLQGGCYRGACILQPATLAEMHRRHYSDDPRLPGWTLGFMEGFLGGSRLIGHSGARPGFGSDLELLPEQGLGYFLSFNLECLGSSACSIVPAFRRQLVDRFFPARPANPAPFLPQTDPRTLAGSYRHTWYPHRTADKIRVLDLDDLRVFPAREGIRVEGVEYLEVLPLLFQESGGDRQIGFKLDERGRVAYLLRGGAYERLRWYETAPLNRLLFDAWGWLWGATLLAWSAAWLVRRRRERLPLPPRLRLARALAVAVAAFNILFLLGLIRLFWISTLTRQWLLALPLASVALAAAVGVTTVACRRNGSPLVVRIYLALLIVLSALFLLFLHQWNLLGFRL